MRSSSSMMMRTTCHHQPASSCLRSQSSSFLRSRRNVLVVPLGSLTLAGAVLFRPGWSRARAEEVSAPVQVQEILLPREYKRSTQELLETLKRTIELEKSGASEFEVRKSGGPAKEMIKAFLSTKWDDDDAVRTNASYKETTAAIRELGAFYGKKGQRARLPDDVSGSVLAHLDGALNALDAAGERKEGLAKLLENL